MFDWFFSEFSNLAYPFFQTQLVLDTHMAVADTKTVAVDTQTMVADIHRKVLMEQEGTSCQNDSVGATCHHRRQTTYHRLDPRKVSGTRYLGGL